MADDDRLERLLLTDEPTLRALAAWVSLPRASRAAKGLTQWSDSGLWYSEVEWAVAAGLQLPDLRTIRTRLLSMGIVDHDGVAWPPALMLARNLAAAKIKGRRR